MKQAATTKTMATTFEVPILARIVRSQSLALGAIGGVSVDTQMALPPKKTVRKRAIAGVSIASPAASVPAVGATPGAILYRRAS